MDDNTQLRRGALELSILQLLAHGEVYGGEIVETLSAYPSLAASRGTVYPLLSRLRNAGVVETTWHESPVGPPRRYYRLSKAGESTRRSLEAGWEALVRDMAQVIANPASRPVKEQS